jgi:hypothetical protein
MPPKKSSSSTPYKECVSLKVGQILKRFEKGELKIRGRLVKSRNQALALGIRLADVSCEKKQGSRDTSDRLQKIQVGRPSITNVKESIRLLQKFKKKGAHKKMCLLYEYLLQYLLSQCKGLPAVVQEIFRGLYPKPKPKSTSRKTSTTKSKKTKKIKVD